MADEILVPSPVMYLDNCQSMALRLRQVVSQITTEVVSTMELKHQWFHDLNADNRSWISLVARSGLDSFISWFSGDQDIRPSRIFNAAPRLLLRKVSLEQTVELVRTTISVLETQLQILFSGTEYKVLSDALLLYSREIAFAAASIYAQAAEIRGAWDERLEASVIDAIIRGESDDLLISRAATLGWHSAEAAMVLIGELPSSSETTLNTYLDEVRQRITKEGFDILLAPQGTRLVLVIGGERLTDPQQVPRISAKLAAYFGPGAVVFGNVVENLGKATESAQAALFGLRAHSAWAQAPRPTAAEDLLPERILLGDEKAKRNAVDTIYYPLLSAGGDLLETAKTLLENSGSVEGTARKMFVHANTVRYRLRRIQDVTGYSFNDSRHSYLLRLAITLGELAPEPNPLDRFNYNFLR